MNNLFKNKNLCSPYNNKLINLLTLVSLIQFNKKINLLKLRSSNRIYNFNSSSNNLLSNNNNYQFKLNNNSNNSKKLKLNNFTKILLNNK